MIDVDSVLVQTEMGGRMSSRGPEESCLILVSGYAPGLNRFLRWSDDFIARFHLTVKPDCPPEAILDQTVAMEDEIRQYDVFIHHGADAVPEIGDGRDVYDTLLAQIAQGTRLISVPRPRMPALWPFHVRAPAHDAARRPFVSSLDRQPCAQFGDSYVERNADPQRPFQGRFDGSPSPVHDDAYVLGLAGVGLDPAEIADRYVGLDIAHAVDLDAGLEHALNALREGDRTADVKVAEFIATNIRRHRLFCLIDRPNNRLLLHMTNQILDLLGCGRVPDVAIERTQELHGWSCPVHPGIGRHLDLPHVGADMRYDVDRTRRLTFGEYIPHYVANVFRAQARGDR